MTVTASPEAPQAPGPSILDLPPVTVRTRLRRAAPTLISAASIVMLLILWEIVARREIVDPFFTSYPTDIFSRGWEMFSTGYIYPHLWISAQEAGLGFILAVVVGVPIGLLTGRFRVAGAVAEPYIVGMYSTPTVALLPLLILWLGIGLSSKVALIFLGGVFIVIVNTAAGVRGVDQRKIEAARSFMASERQIFTQVILPSTVPFISAGIRLAIGRVLITMFVAELYASNQGIGFLITQAGMRFRTDELFVGIGVLALTGITLSLILRRIEETWLARFQ